MIKLKLTDPTNVDKRIEEYVVGDKGEVILSRNYCEAFDQNSKIWIDFSGKIKQRIIGYISVIVSRDIHDKNIRSKAELYSLDHLPAIGLHPIIVDNGSNTVKSEIPNLSIEELVYEFNPNTITQEHRKPTK